MNSYAKSSTISASTTITSSTIQQPPSPSSASHHGHYQRQSSPTTFAHQLRILIPCSNYDNLMDNIRVQQPHSSRAGSSGMQADRRNIMGDRRMNAPPMMDRQMVRFELLIDNLNALNTFISHLYNRTIMIHRRHLIVVPI